MLMIVQKDVCFNALTTPNFTVTIKQTNVSILAQPEPSAITTLACAMIYVSLGVMSGLIQLLSTPTLIQPRIFVWRSALETTLPIIVRLHVLIFVRWGPMVIILRGNVWLFVRLTHYPLPWILRVYVFTSARIPSTVMKTVASVTNNVQQALSTTTTMTRTTVA